MSRIKYLLLGLLVAALAVGPLLVGGGSVAVAAVNPNKSICEGSGGTWSGSACTNPQAEGRTVEGMFGTIVDILIFVIGAVAVLMLVIGGIKYTTSGGDQAAVASAKNTILYAIVGIVLAFAAYAIVKFVVTKL